MKLKKGKKSKKRRGTRLHGFAAKKHKGKGNTGGKGMSGTGKRADQKITYINRYFPDYFGGEGLKAKGNKLMSINVGNVSQNVQSFIKNGTAKKTKEGVEINLEGYKVLGDGEVKEKLIVKAGSFSSRGKEKIEKAGGKAIALKKEEVKENGS